jgi:large subunit ribosomal protein L18
MNSHKLKQVQRLRRRRHVRRKIVGTVERPRLTVFRSSKHIYAQLIDDLTGRTLAAASSLAPDLRKDVVYGGNVKAAQAVGKRLAELAKERGITKAAFDRGHYRYHGRIKALADAAREGGLQF